VLALIEAEQQRHLGFQLPAADRPWQWPPTAVLRRTLRTAVDRRESQTPVREFTPATLVPSPAYRLVPSDVIRVRPGTAELDDKPVTNDQGLVAVISGQACDLL